MLSTLLGGGGKVPINPQYITKIDDEAIHFRNFEELFRYPLKSFTIERRVSLPRTGD